MLHIEVDLFVFYGYYIHMISTGRGLPASVEYSLASRYIVAFITGEYLIQGANHLSHGYHARTRKVSNESE